MRMASFGGPGGGPHPEWIRRRRPPENEIPVAVPLNTVLARTDDVAIALLGLQVYSTGLSFDLAIRCRASFARDGRGLDGILFGRPGPEGRLLVGLEFPDGRRVRSSGRPFPRPGDDSDVVFQPGGGSGDLLAADQSWWLNPLPPAGPLTFVVRSDQLGIPETSAALDGELIRRAASDVVELWPWEPPPERMPPHERMPDLPDDSWFAG